MHRAFHIPEFLAMVMAECDTKSLAQMARVCRDAHPHAVAQLWKDLDTLYNLLKTLPNHAFNVWLDELGCIPHQLKRSLVPEDWQSFCRHAELTHNLSLDVDKLTIPLLDSLARNKHIQYIFPNIHSLNMTWRHSPRKLSGGTLLLSPTLSTLTLNAWSVEIDANLELCVFLANVAFHCPALSYLKIDFLSDNVPGSIRLGECIRRFCELREIEFFLRKTSKILEGVLQPLAELPSLKKLTMPFPDQSSLIKAAQESISCSQGYYSYFSAMHYINFQPMGCFPEVFGSLIGKVPLNYVAVAFDSIATPQEMVNLTTTLQSCTSILKYLYILPSQNRKDIGRSSMTALRAKSLAMTGESLSPLLSFNLVNLHIEHDIHMAISDDFLELIPDAWISLNYLKLVSRSTYDKVFGSPSGIGCEGRPLVTQTGLTRLASRCLHLEHLAIRFDCTNGTDDYLPSDRLYFSSSLVSFDVGMSWTGDETLTALWLSDIFPYLKEMRVDPQNTQRNMWNNAFKFVPVMQKARLQERSRVARPCYEVKDAGMS